MYIFFVVVPQKIGDRYKMNFFTNGSTLISVKGYMVCPRLAYLHTLKLTKGHKQADFTHVAHIPEIWYHHIRPIKLFLVVNNFRFLDTPASTTPIFS